jgi:hypothetical protein
VIGAWPGGRQLFSPAKKLQIHYRANSATDSCRAPSFIHQEIMTLRAMTGAAFLKYVEQCLVPTLKRKDIVIVDNLAAHKVVGKSLPAVRRQGPRSIPGHY